MNQQLLLIQLAKARYLEVTEQNHYAYMLTRSISFYPLNCSRTHPFSMQEPISLFYLSFYSLFLDAQSNVYLFHYSPFAFNIYPIECRHTVLLLTEAPLAEWYLVNLCTTVFRNICNLALLHTQNAKPTITYSIAIAV